MTAARRAMRSTQEIVAEIQAFEAQFTPPRLPPGTPNRRARQREIDHEAHARACLPENIARRLELRRELRRAQHAERARAAAKARAADPLTAVRRRLSAKLRALGFKREHTSGRSAYYRHGLLIVRVSDQEVPDTPDREWNREHGHFTWAGSGASFIVGQDDPDEWLEWIKRTLAKDTICS